MKKNVFLPVLALLTSLASFAQTQNQDLNMGLYQLRFPSANGGSNRIQSFGGTFPGTWLFKSRFDNITLDAGENSGNRYKILFLSGGIERARMDGDGNFGIGTTSPSAKLDVKGTIKASHANGKYINLFTSGDGNGYINFGGGATSSRFGFQIDGSSKMSIMKNGNVGIGTTNPAARLDVLSNTGQTESLMRFRVSDAPADYLQIANSTGSPNQFIPVIKGHHQTDNRYSLQLIGSTTDANDTGSNALVNFDARRPNGPIQNRTLFSWTSYTKKLMTMKANGNLGIGTTNPLTKLHINNGDNSYGAILANANESNFSLYTKTLTTQPSNVESFRLGLKYGPNENNGFISFYRGGSASGGFLGLSTSGSERMRIASNGNVGIGTTNPLSKLTVVGHVNIGGEGNYRLRTRHIDGKDYQSRAVSDLYLNYNTGKHVRVGFGGQDSNMFVSGNVGIGTTDTKGYKLGIKGKIAAEEVKVALYSTWPDFVFENNYELPSLQEVEQHITKKGHLENIPSAAEVAENGIQLGEMNAKLLQKIEELTLYMIEQNKKTENLIKEVAILKQKNTELEKKIIR